MTIKMKQRKGVMKGQRIRTVCLQAKWVANEIRRMGIFEDGCKDGSVQMLCAPWLPCGIVYGLSMRRTHTWEERQQ